MSLEYPFYSKNFAKAVGIVQVTVHSYVVESFGNFELEGPKYHLHDCHHWLIFLSDLPHRDTHNIHS